MLFSASLPHTRFVRVNDYLFHACTVWSLHASISSQLSSCNWPVASLFEGGSQFQQNVDHFLKMNFDVEVCHIKVENVCHKVKNVYP